MNQRGKRGGGGEEEGEIEIWLVRNLTLIISHDSLMTVT